MWAAIDFLLFPLKNGQWKLQLFSSMFDFVIKFLDAVGILDPIFKNPGSFIWCQWALSAEENFVDYPALGVLVFLPRNFLDFWHFLPRFWQLFLARFARFCKIFQDRGKESKKIFGLLGKKNKNNQHLGKRNKKLASK